MRVSCEFDEVLPRFPDELLDDIAPEDEHVPPMLTLARYSPSRYRHGSDEEEG